MVAQLDKTCRRWGTLIILVISVLLYANTLDNDFVLDDTTYIQGNYLLRDLGNLPQFFNVPADGVVEDLSPGFLRGRNIRWVTYAIDFALGGGAPWMFHLSNILWHSLTGVALFFLFNRWFQRSGSALLATLLFISHPIQTSAVAYISGRKDILAAFFLCCAFLAVYRYRETDKRRWLPIVLGLFFLGYFSKEVAVIFPLLLLFSDWCLSKERDSRAAVTACWRQYWHEYLFLFGTAGLFTWWSIGARLLGKLAAIWGGESALAVTQSGIVHAADVNLSFANLMVFYLTKLFWPANLLADYKGAFDFSLYPEQYGVVFFLVFLAALFFCLIFLRRHSALAALGLGWIIIALLPVSHIIDFHYPVAEHYLYLPCVGFALMVGSVATCDKYRQFWIAALIGVVVCYSALTFSRNNDWQDMETLTLDILEKVPYHQRASNTLVHIFAEKGNYDAALEHARIVLAENPLSAINNYNLGFLYEEKEDFKRAELHYRRAILIKPTFWDAYLNLGNMLLENDYESSGLKVMQQLNERYGYHPLTFLVLGVNRARQGQWSNALKNFERGLSIDANEGRLKLGIAVSLWSMGRDSKRVMRLYAEALESNVLESVDTDQPPWEDFFSQTKFNALQ